MLIDFSSLSTFGMRTHIALLEAFKIAWSIHAVKNTARFREGGHFTNQNKHMKNGLCSYFSYYHIVINACTASLNHFFSVRLSVWHFPTFFLSPASSISCCGQFIFAPCSTLGSFYLLPLLHFCSLVQSQVNQDPRSHGN